MRQRGRKIINIHWFRQIKDHKVSYVFAVMVVTIIPLFIFPVRINSWVVNIGQFIDVYNFGKVIVLVVLALSMSIFLIKRNKRYPAPFTNQLPFNLFIVWILIAAIFSTHLKISLLGYPRRWQGLFVYVSYAVVYFFIVNTFDLKQTTGLLRWLFISSAFIAVYSLLQYYGFEPANLITTKYSNVIDPNIVRGTIGNRNFAGSYFVLMTLTTVFMYFRNEDKKKELILYSLSVLFFAALLASLTRGTWIGAFVAFCVCLWILRKSLRGFYKKVIMIIATFVITILFMNITGGGAIASRYKLTINELQIKNAKNIESLGADRVYAYKKALEMIENYPITGVGPDCAAFYIVITKGDVQNHPELSEITYYSKVHSEYLEYAATMGIPALLFYLWFILSIFVKYVRQREWKSGESTGIFAGWLAYLAQSVFNIGVIGVLPVFFVYCALLNKYVNKKGEVVERQP